LRMSQLSWSWLDLHGRRMRCTFDTSSCPVSCSVAGRLVFPAPPSTFHRCRLGPRGLPALAALPSPKLGDVGRRGLSPLLQSAPHSAGTRSQSLPKQRPWTPPLMALPAFCPSAVQPFARPLPATPRSHLRAVGTNRLLVFRPRGLSPPRRFPPRDSCRFVAPCCQP